MRKKIIDKKRTLVFSICFLFAFTLIVLSMHFCDFLESDPLSWKEIGDDIEWILLASFFAAIVCVFKYEDIHN